MMTLVKNVNIFQNSNYLLKLQKKKKKEKRGPIYKYILCYTCVSLHDNSKKMES